jgi:hypothetical protein
MNEKQIRELARFIRTNHLGPENATTNGALARAFNLSDLGSSGRQEIPGSSEMADALLRAREMGLPIVSDWRGVYYARYREDADQAIEHFRRCEERYLRNRSALTFAANKLPRQPVSSPGRAA